MNFLLDATLGMLIIWLAVKLTSKLVEYKQWTLLSFGEYGEFLRTLNFIRVGHQRAAFTNSVLAETDLYKERSTL